MTEPGIFYAPYIPLQWVRVNFTVVSPFPTWLDKLKQWDFEAYQIQQEENIHMAILRDEEIAKERDRSDLLQACARLEGSMSATSKVEQGHLFDLLMIVRAVIEQK
jgi:hypothetical protein